MIDLKSLLSEIVTRLEQAKENGLKPEFVPSAAEYKVKVPAGDASYLIRLKEEKKGVSVATFLAGRQQHRVMMPEASLNDALRVHSSGYHYRLRQILALRQYCPSSSLCTAC